MIHSILEPKNIHYKSGYGIDEDDIEYNTSIYDYEWNGIETEIALGKIKYTYSKYGVLFCSIYLIVNDSPSSRIGVFEIKESEILNSMDDDGLDMEKGNILIFASAKYINRMLQKTTKKPSINIDKTADVGKTALNAVEVDDVMKLDIADTQISTGAVAAADIIGDNIFTSDATVISPPLLPDENQLDSDEITSEYKESPKNNWIETFSRNNKYSIIENEGKGDCFFAVVRDAFRQIGKQTTVKKIRAVLAKEVTNELLVQYKTLYTNFLTEYQTLSAEMAAIEKMNKEMKRRILNVTDKTEHSQILKDATELTDRYKRLKENRSVTKSLLNEFLYMQEINSIEQLQAFVMTPQYWADEWAISTLERVLNIKMILLDEKAFENGDSDGVLLCGPTHDTTKSLDFSPDYYIMTSYDKNHYRLVSYKSKYIFKFREIPHNIKTMVINKCLERNSGIYYLINDFRNYKTKLGVDANYGEPVKDEDDILNKDMYDSDTVFMFHSKSNNIPHAGKGIGEHIPASKMTQYNELNGKKKTDITYDWRKKLDDSWASPFTLDGHRWNTVTHYMSSAQYKKGFPDFYMLFSLDSESEISKSVDMAVAATSKSGKHNDILLRPDNVTVDADFFGAERSPRNVEERYRAIEAKFSQNLDLKRILMDTKRAKLVKFVRRNDPEPDMLLMKLRKEIA